MKYMTLINLLDDYNENNIAAVLELRPKKAVFVFLDNLANLANFNDLKGMLGKKVPGLEIESFMYKEGSMEDIKQLFSSCNPEGTVVNLSEGPKLLSLISYRMAVKNNISAIYIDLVHKRIIDMNNLIYKDINPDIIDLTVEDMIKSTGAQVVKESCGPGKKNCYTNMLVHFADNYGQWKLAKEIFRDSSRLRHNQVYILNLAINLNHIREDAKYALEWFLGVMLKEGLISSYRMGRSMANLQFKDREAKSFILFAGGWLEALTFWAISQIQGVDDVRSGVVFSWARKRENISNELDVVATVDGRLICISCKDTDRYDVEDLNELEVYAKRLGGREVIKILVATELPKRAELVLHRAEEMDIGIIIFKGDMRSFIHELELNVNKR